MPFFKTTANIFIDNGEYFDPNWMDSDTLILPPKLPWDYKKEMQIEDIDLWELIYEGSYCCVYAAWNPYAEFYLVLGPYDMKNNREIMTFYGKQAQVSLKSYLKKYRINLPQNSIWVDVEDMWLYN